MSCLLVGLQLLILQSLQQQAMHGYNRLQELVAPRPAAIDLPMPVTTHHMATIGARSFLLLGLLQLILQCLQQHMTHGYSKLQ
jgi:hypothetical protein